RGHGRHRPPPLPRHGDRRVPAAAGRQLHHRHRRRRLVQELPLRRLPPVQERRAPPERGGAAAVPVREAGHVGVGHHRRAGLLHDPGGGAGGAVREQGLRGVRAALAAPGRVRRRRPAPPEPGLAAQVPGVRDAPRRPAGALHRRQLRVRPARPRQL
uniref:Uncharacterized protein n=1 Tax=Triticum urartu TaxID=4572 RepID=A0A8R7R8V1_TRIUA